MSQIKIGQQAYAKWYPYASLSYCAYVCMCAYVYWVHICTHTHVQTISTHVSYKCVLYSRQVKMNFSWHLRHWTTRHYCRVLVPFNYTWWMEDLKKLTFPPFNTVPSERKTLCNTSLKSWGLCSTLLKVEYLFITLNSSAWKNCLLSPICYSFIHSHQHKFRNIYFILSIIIQSYFGYSSCSNFDLWLKQVRLYRTITDHGPKTLPYHEN